MVSVGGYGVRISLASLIELEGKGREEKRMKEFVFLPLMRMRSKKTTGLPFLSFFFYLGDSSS